MQFHPLAYIVKLNIEMSMAELIAKVAKTQEPLHTIHSSRRRRVASSSALPSFSRSSNQIQVLPPVRNAVPFKVWSAASSVGRDRGESHQAGPLQGFSDIPRVLSDEAQENPPQDFPGYDLYVVQETTVESEVISYPNPIQSDMMIQSHSGTCSTAVNNSTPDGDLQPPRIWDGSISTLTFIETS